MRSGPWLALHARLAGRSECVTTVAGFIERVGAESDGNSLVDELVHDVHVVPLVKVVHELGPFIADETKTLELRMVRHTAVTLAAATEADPGRHAPAPRSGRARPLPKQIAGHVATVGTEIIMIPPNSSGAPGWEHRWDQLRQ